MNCKRGDLALVVVPYAGCEDHPFNGRIVTVGVDGECDLGTYRAPPPEPPGWLCEFARPVFLSLRHPTLAGPSEGPAKIVCKCNLYDSWLHPISAPGGAEDVPENVTIAAEES
ncbi:Uncharacterised protein [Burkholderia pseudomallei]|nr:Uncharacterised protein [Burkholderia pseudomallei]